MWIYKLAIKRDFHIFPAFTCPRNTSEASVIIEGRIFLFLYAEHLCKQFTDALESTIAYSCELRVHIFLSDKYINDHLW